ncbi:3-deoxy-D-manno-octulosonic acid transferase [Citrifermentans bremense]|uniref:3-deoxy-D-manno-octulosonic acid transferase n=1 Tax=Citrifermentans bremense TaxID=60035 RepID=UPI000401DDAB|nr:3-deoxy-D-manno-octulosonic acid transferase [Citrifermentans bremense]
MIDFIYNLLLWLLLPLLVPYHAYRSLSRGRRTAFMERFGVIPEAELEPLKGKRTILVHAVSVGETLAAQPLLKGIRSRFPEHRVVITNVTETGRGVALKSNSADLCIYFPFDYPFAVRAVLKKVSPDLVVIMETEIWPNFIKEAGKLGIPVLLANGRISDRSLSRYLRFSWFFRPVLQRLSALCMQSAEDASRIEAIGARPETVHVAGNLKYDIPLRPKHPGEVSWIKAKYGIPEGAFVFTAASTHEGEEGLVLEAYRMLLSARPESFLVLAPRHPERAAGVAEQVKKSGFSFRRRSQLEAEPAPQQPGEVFILDTVGELAGLYGASDLVFVGGSLVPTGGHNPLEPAACGIPVLFGPHMENFREIAATFLAKEAGIQLAGAAELGEKLVSLSGDAAGRDTMGRNGAGILAESAGSTTRHLDAMAASLGGSRG